MKKEICIAIYWRWCDFSCLKRRYGVRIGSLWIGVKTPVTDRDIDNRKDIEVKNGKS